MTSAYAAARKALFDEILEIVPKVLDFQDGEQIAVGPIGDTMLVICTKTTSFGGIPFLSLPEKEYRRRGPGSAIQQLHRTLRYLVRDRMWRERGGPAPPAALFKTNHLTDMVCRDNKTSPQDLIDSTWGPVELHDGWSEAREWRSHLKIPDVMLRSPINQRETRHTPETLPWVSGVVLHDEFYVDALGIIPDSAIYRLTRFGPTELRVPDNWSTYNDLVEGQAVADIKYDGVRLGDANRILIDDLRYAGATRFYSRSVRFMTEGEYLWEQTYFGGHAEDEVRAEYNRRIRQLFLKRARIEATIVRYLQPFALPATN